MVWVNSRFLRGLRTAIGASTLASAELGRTLAGARHQEIKTVCVKL